ncbi:hypothetical protein EVG20_g2223 [Dentipellis fragilis]|uniref:U3 small nucleolar RNA-associated protein 10 n=1 Tax=Dentipellis fragilis TaxID=205917 RepID=A0A4Y9ZAA5_9AGAM|nr:hypothetical protein EVG20_g2223 [Dentipellis fragilis]
MVTSLAAQLAQNTSLNSALLVDRSRRKPTASYLFTGRDADQHDLDSIHALASNAFLQLRQLSPALYTYEAILFSDAAKGVDRTLLQADAAKELDANIKAALSLLGPYLMEAPTAKVLEWLVRRFRINEFNVEDVLALFLPYHESPHFAKMVTILHIQANSFYSFLSAYKSAAQAVPRAALVQEMLRSPDLSRFVAALLPNALKKGKGYTHHTLIAFHAGTLLDFIARSKTLDDAVLAFLLPAMLEPLQAELPEKEVVLANYILLCALSQKCTFTPSALKTIMGSMASCASCVVTKQFVHAAVAVLSPQEPLKKLSNSAVEKVLALPDLDNALVETFSWAGSEKLVGALIAALIDRLFTTDTEIRATTLLNALLVAPETPSSLLKQIATVSVDRSISTESSTSEKAVLRRLLSSLYQRHPVVLQDVTQKMIEENEDVRDAVEELSVSLTVTGSSSKKVGESDLILASMDADVSVRVAGVRNMVAVLTSNSESLDPEYKDAIHTALLGRVLDNTPQILTALYAEPSAVVPIFRTHSASYISALSTALTSKSQHTRETLRIHVAFLADHYTPGAGPAVTKEVFERIVFPFLLFSKPRQKSAVSVWGILDVSEAQGEREPGLREYELLAGCADVVRWEEGQVGRKKRGGAGGLESMQVMANANMAVAARMAETILISNEHAQHFAFFLAKLKDTDSHARGLAYLVVRALLGKMSGEHQIEAARRVLEAMSLKSLEGMEGFMDGADNLQEFLNDTTLGKNVVTKPNSQGTTHWLQTSLLAMMPIIPRPMTAQLDWLDGTSLDSPDIDIGARYVNLMRTVYRLANSSTSLPLLSTALLRAQFINLSDDALAFLAGIWLTNPRDVGQTPFRHAALCHAAAFLSAHESTEHAVDFQTILPSLLVALQDSDTAIRIVALDCVHLLVKLSDGKTATGVYAFDSIYGQGSSQLQYLDWADYHKYAKAVTEFRDHIVNDPGYIRVFQLQYLAWPKSDSRKAPAIKRRVLCYLLSHANGCRLPEVKLSLLHMLEGVSDSNKALILLPSIQALSDEARSKALKAAFGSRFEEFATLLVSCIDVSTVSELNNNNGSLWPAFIAVLRHYLLPKSLSSPRQALLHHLEHGVFSGLTLVRKLEICQLLLEISTEDVESQTYCKAALDQLLQGVELLVVLLNNLQPVPKDPTQRANKRPKLDQSPSTGPIALAKLGILVEVLSGMYLPGSLDLLSCLMDLLNKVANTNAASQADTVYVEQLLMSVIENVAGNIQDTTKVSPTAIRLEILVDIVRVAENPQTFHQALLLMASLARLAPESVLHHIMPVFTFMGANVFHRDDIYSFRVVQKTIDNIVPVMVSSLREKHPDRLDLQIASRDFLRIFTEAANHIPRHRRTHFFTHLADVLGPEDFLAPLCVLIISKVANRIVRQHGEELQATLALPLSILHHHAPAKQIPGLIDILGEALHEISHVVDAASTEKTILDFSRDDEQPSQTSAYLKRRAQSLITFVGTTLETSTSAYTATQGVSTGSINNLVSVLLTIASRHDVPLTEADGTDLPKAARLSIDQCLKVMSAVDFINAIINMLDADETSVKAEALRLFADRLVAISETVRKQSVPAVVKVIAKVKTFLAERVDSLVRPAFGALKAVGSAPAPGEEGALTECVPLVVSALRDARYVASAVAVLPPLCSNLGPRIIPHFRFIIEECVNIIRTGTKEGSKASSALIGDALKVLQALFSAIPTFWGKPELNKVVTLHLDLRASAVKFEDFEAFIRAIAKKAPSTVVIPTLCELWPSLQAAEGDAALRFEAYSALLKRAVRSASRAIILENLRSLFKVFLEAFDLRGKLSVEEVSKVEPTTISAFIELTTKLNETAFKPLFRRLFDWAFADAGLTKKITFCRIYIALLDYFKALMTPYMSFVMPQFIALLQEDNADEHYPELWSCIVQTLSKSFSVDEGFFWREDKQRQIIPVLISQIPKCVDLRDEDAKDQQVAALVALADTADDDNLLKKINLDVLMHTRSEEVRIRLFALRSSEALWSAHGSKFMGYVPETTTFIAECAEDENDSVVQATHKLKDAVEKATGESIDNL